jgi:hypothetical protein
MVPGPPLPGKELAGVLTERSRDFGRIENGEIYWEKIMRDHLVQRIMLEDGHNVRQLEHEGLTR